MCSRVFWPDNPIAAVAARTMDWAISDEPEIWVLPRGMSRTGGDDPHAIEWISQYGSVTVSGFGVGITDGINEAGLGFHLLYLEETTYEDADARPTVSNTRVMQLIADTCANVAEAVARLNEVRIYSTPVNGEHLGVHFSFEDSSGDSAIVEIVEGITRVHHERSCTVMTNDPIYEEQLVNLARYRPFGGELPLPGDILSPDRFVRASYFLHYLPEPQTYAEALAGPVLIARNVAVPPGAPYDDFAVYPTWWISAVDVTNLAYYFQVVTSPNLIWLELGDLDFSEGAPALSLDPKTEGLIGDVRSQFAPMPAIF